MTIALRILVVVLLILARLTPTPTVGDEARVYAALTALLDDGWALQRVTPGGAA